MSSRTTPDLHWSTTFLVAGTRQLTQSISQLLASKYGPPAFDTSHILASGDSTITTGTTSAGLRWDAIHYVAIAKDGYQYEQQLAFMPLWPLLMRVVGEILAFTRGGMGRYIDVFERDDGVTTSDLVLSGGLVNVMISAAAAAYLYKLTRALTGSHRFAQLACLFYALPPHPGAAVSPYTEPLFAFLTFAGFYFAVKSKYLNSALLLALATGVRATGVLNIAILGWHILFGTTIPSPRHLQPSVSFLSRFVRAPQLTVKRLLPRALLAAPLCALVIAPFLAFQYYAYLSFCTDQITHRTWCDARVPMPYSFVQVEYWNNGLFNYWTLEQLPNFILAAPVLLVSIIPSASYLRNILRAGPASAVPHRHPALLPFHLHHLLITALLAFGSHTQIALRTAITDPVVWWNVASVAFKWAPMYGQRNADSPARDQAKKPVVEDELLDAGKRMTTVGRVWVSWAVVWGGISLVLWSAHLPPA